MPEVNWQTRNSRECVFAISTHKQSWLAGNQKVPMLAGGVTSSSALFHRVIHTTCQVLDPEGLSLYHPAVALQLTNGNNEGGALHRSVILVAPLLCFPAGLSSLALNSCHSSLCSFRSSDANTYRDIKINNGSLIESGHKEWMTSRRCRENGGGVDGSTGE